MIAIKIVTTIAVPVQVVWDVIYELKDSKEMDANLDFMQILRKSDNYEERYFQHKLPFPFANRDVAVGLVIS